MTEEAFRFWPVPGIQPEDFAEFADILEGEPDFPATFDAWDQMSARRERELAEEGYQPIAILIRPTGFRQYLRDTGAALNIDSLTAYAKFQISKKRTN